MQLADKRSERAFEIRLVSSATRWPCPRLLTPARSTAGQISRSQPPLLYLERPIAETDGACCATVVRRVPDKVVTHLPRTYSRRCAWTRTISVGERTRTLPWFFRLDQSPRFAIPTQFHRTILLLFRPIVRYSDDGLNSPPSSFVTLDISKTSLRSPSPLQDPRTIYVLVRGGHQNQASRRARLARLACTTTVTSGATIFGILVTHGIRTYTA